MHKDHDARIPVLHDRLPGDDRGCSQAGPDNGLKQTGLMETCHGNGSSLSTEEQGHFVGFRHETPNRNGR